MKSTRWPIWLVAAAIAIVGFFWGIYRFADPEQLEIDSSVRQTVAGEFASLSDGYTHYQLGGPVNGRVVVLAAGFSVPYYIWDPTFESLAGAGFRVLRYDYYGRGYSDRPYISYNDDLYIRQLDQLLHVLHIPEPVDLVGISFGASVITNFADKYPERVRSLVYFDPSIRRPHGTTLLADFPSVWSYLTVLFDERYWATSQLDDFFHPERFPDWPTRYREQLRYRGFRLARLSDFVSNAEVDQGDQLKRVGEHPRPVFVIWGKEDQTVAFEESEWFMTTLPHASLLAVESAAHLPQWEQPEVVHPQLIRFLRE